MSPLFVDRFGRSLQVYHLEFDKDAIYDSLMAHFRVLGAWGLNFNTLFTVPGAWMSVCIVVL